MVDETPRCDHGIWIEYCYETRTSRAQHGPNPEHSLVITDEEMRDWPSPYHGQKILGDWIKALHEREARLS